MQNPIERAIDLAGGTRAVARELEMSEWGVRKWVHDGIPPKHVLWLAARCGWQATPHDLAPEIYPNPSDGIPPGKRWRPRAVAGSGVA